MDGIITGSDKLANGENARSYGYVAAGEHIAEVVKGKKNLTVSEGFDMAMIPVSDGISGYAAGNMIGKPLGLGPGNAGKGVPIPPVGRGRYTVLTSEVEAGAGAGGGIKPAIKVVASAADENMNVPLPRQKHSGTNNFRH